MVAKTTLHRNLCLFPRLATLAALVWLASCSVSDRTVQKPVDGPPEEPIDVASIQDAVPRMEPRSRYGNPESYEVYGRRHHVLDSAEGYVERGIASWYGTKFHGRRTSSGEPYDMFAMTAAHKTLPLPAYARVTNLENGRQAVVRINDRGPFHDNRIIDLSYAAATKLGIASKGTGLVEVRTVAPSPGKDATAPTQPSVAGTPLLYLQVGAFTNRDNADRLARRLTTETGAEVHIRNVEHEGLSLFRVRLGPLDSVADADQLERKLASLGIAPQVVVE